MGWNALLRNTAFLAVALIALGGLAAVSEGAPSPGPNPSPNPIPAMTLSLDYTDSLAHPTNIAPGTAVIDGTVVMDKVPGERVFVTLIPVVDLGWPVSCSPPTVIFTNNKVSTFVTYVSVPIGTPTSYVGTLTIEARASSIGFSLRTVSQAAVMVAPYYYFYVSSPMPFIETPPAGTVTFDVQVDNWGNADDSYDVSVQNQEELAIKGWTVTFSTTTLSRVAAHHTKILKMTVHPALSSTLYKAEGTPIDVIAYSRGSMDAGVEKTAELQFIVYERGIYIDVIAAGATTLSISLFLLAAIPVTIAVQRVLRRRKQRRADEEE
jgi:hypothetical protein